VLQHPDAHKGVRKAIKKQGSQLRKRQNNIAQTQGKGENL